MTGLYNESYFMEKWPGSLGRFFGEFDPEKHHKTRFFIKQLKQCEVLIGGRGRLLDVGCANGVFVWLAKEQGWDAEGLDISPFAAKRGREQFGVTIREGDIHGLSPDERYDLITLWDTIEHLTDPKTTLHACFRRLKPGGILALLTPDVSSLVNCLVNTAYRVAPRHARSFAEKLYHEDHLIYFSRSALCAALVEAGFLVHSVEDYDEDPRDTETTGLLRAALFLVHIAAALVKRRHELLVWARKPL